MREHIGPDEDLPAPVHPLDIFERVADQEGWECVREETNALSLEFNGAHLPYHLELTWMEEIDILVISSPVELKVPAHRLQEFKELLRLLNAELWVGHFDYWVDEGITLFRYSLLLPSDSELSYGQCQSMVMQAVGQWDFYFPTFQYVMWAGKTAKEALTAVQFATEGEA